MKIIKNIITTIITIWLVTGLLHIISYFSGGYFDFRIYIFLPIIVLSTLGFVRYIFIPLFEWANKD